MSWKSIQVKHVHPKTGALRVDIVGPFLASDPDVLKLLMEIMQKRNVVGAEVVEIKEPEQ